MARIMAIDYGTKRTGIAVTDPLQIIANALATIHSKDAVKFIADYCQKETVETIVVGDPRDMNNSASDVAKHINGFVIQLKKAIPAMDIKRYDERFTSKIASQTILSSGIGKKNRQDKSLVDRVSAVIILQSYMESIGK